MEEHVCVLVLLCMAPTILCTGGCPVHSERGIFFCVTPQGPFTDTTLVSFSAEINADDVSAPNMTVAVCQNHYSLDVMPAADAVGHFLLQARIRVTQRCNGSSVAFSYTYMVGGNLLTGRPQYEDPIIFLFPAETAKSLKTRPIVIPLITVVALVALVALLCAALYFWGKKRTLRSPKSADSPGESATIPCSTPLTSEESLEMLP